MTKRSKKPAEDINILWTHEVRQWLKGCCGSRKCQIAFAGIYVLSAYKMVRSVAHLTQCRLKPLAPSRGIYIVSHHSERNVSHGEKV